MYSVIDGSMSNNRNEIYNNKNDVFVRELTYSFTTNCRNVSKLMLSAYFRDIDNLKELLKNEENVDNTDSSGHTAMHYAAAGGCRECIEVLLEADANIDIQDNNGTTPLMIAIKGDAGNLRYFCTPSVNY